MSSNSTLPPQLPPPPFSVADMALYNLDRARAVIRQIADKPRWGPQDTAAFDCMHYLGDAAIVHGAERLCLRPGAHVLDIGSGFGGTGRFLHTHYGVDVTGVELNPNIHAIAEQIADRSGLAAHVRSFHVNFLELDPLVLSRPVQHIVSYLCILHTPASARGAMFRRASALLPPGGTMYIEDFFARGAGPTAAEREALRDIVSCPHLPSEADYRADLQGAGFGDIQFEDVSPLWASFTAQRAAAYKDTAARSAALDTFYATVAALFAGGRLGGTRITCMRL